MERRFIFRNVNSHSATISTLYLHLVADGRLWWNIDLPHVKSWRQNTGIDIIHLLDSCEHRVGSIYLTGDHARLDLDGQYYVHTDNPVLFDLANASSLLASFPRLDINLVDSQPDGIIEAGLAFSEDASICWFNRESSTLRRSASPLSRVIGDKTSMTDKWESIFKLSAGGLPSPDVFLLYLRDAYILNGSLVFTSNGSLVGCTEQLGITLGPWTNHASCPLGESEEIKFLLSLQDSPGSQRSIKSSFESIDESLICFLYSQCHTGFGHHLGQSTTSSYFVNLINKADSIDASNLLCLYRGGLYYEPFRKDLYHLSLDVSPPVRSLTSGLIRVPRLIVPSSLANYGNHWAGFADTYRLIREQARELSTLASLDLAGLYSGIYLSRRGFNRGCSNQEEISRLFKKLGFLEYSPPGSLGIVDQIALMSHFDLIFAPYGSGANNLVFSRDNSHLVQPLCALADGQSWDYSSAQMMEADYTYLFFHPECPDASFHERRYVYAPEVIGGVIRDLLDRA